MCTMLCINCPIECFTSVLTKQSAISYQIHYDYPTLNIMLYNTCPQPVDDCWKRNRPFRNATW